MFNILIIGISVKKGCLEALSGGVDSPCLAKCISAGYKQSQVFYEDLKNNGYTLLTLPQRLPSRYSICFTGSIDLPEALGGE